MTCFAEHAASISIFLEPQVLLGSLDEGRV